MCHHHCLHHFFLEYLPLIRFPLSTSDLVEDIVDNILGECQQNKWKEYVEGTKLKYIPFSMAIETIFGESFFFGSHIAKNMA